MRKRAPQKPETYAPETVEPLAKEPEVRADKTETHRKSEMDVDGEGEERKSWTEVRKVKVEEAEVRLVKILEEAASLGVRASELNRLWPVQGLLGFGHGKRSWSSSGFWAFVMALATLCLFSSSIQTEIIKAWFSFQQTPPNVEKCLSYVPDCVSNLFRPLEDCSICLNVTGVDKVSNISAAEFELSYVERGRPVVVTDGAREWSAQEVFDFSFFKQIYQESSENWLFQSACQFFPYKTEFKALKDVFSMDQARANMSHGTEPWYVGWSNCDERVSRILREHYEPPYFLPPTSENKQTDWIFIGSPGYGAKMHIDNVKYPSWQAQLRGSKTWTLEPPLECHYKCNTLTVDVHPGEIIVLDTNRWYHQTQITSKELSITIGAEFD